MRDWSEAGIEERSACNKKITDKLAVLFKVGVGVNNKKVLPFLIFPFFYTERPVSNRIFSKL